VPVLYFLSITVLRHGKQRNQEFADLTWSASVRPGRG